MQKRVLTEHQKEVMRSKRRASCVPALYNDLSQSSQTDSMDTQSSDNPVETTKPLVTIIDKEEDALMEPPIVLKQLEVLSELPDKGNLVGTLYLFLCHVQIYIIYFCTCRSSGNESS